MIQLVFKPEKAPVVRHEGLYGMYMDGHLLLHVRARNARHAEEKIRFLLERETRGKTIAFDLDRFEDEFRQFRKFWAEKVLKEDGNGENAKRNASEILPPGRAEGASEGHGPGADGDAVGAGAVHNDVKGE